MRKAGIREARQNLSVLLEEVRKGREVLITDRGRPVARLVAPEPPQGKGVPDLSAFRASLPKIEGSVSETLLRMREEW